MTDVRLLSDVVNNVVVQIEGRRYPGMVIQGDRPKEWARLADSNDVESLQILAQALRDAVIEYDRVVAEHGRALE